jgi:threonylcarbamoyladenosine tRNA methylthiotransferase MtaB
LRKLINLGCKLNQYEGYCLLEQFPDIENLVIVNTCCVTREAEVKSQKKFRQALRSYPEAFVVASGCACRLNREAYAQAKRIVDNVERNAIIKNTMPTPKKARYFLKVQDGCNMPCSYCIVAKLRSHIESKSLKDIKIEIMHARSMGYGEVVLVGANIGLYGIDIDTSLAEMLSEISKLEDIPRMRLSSVEPLFIDERLVEVLKDLPFCRHFHIPVQSADDSILKNMNRNYDIAQLSRIIDLIHENFSDVAIGADVIVGFPGEGEGEFHNTRRFIEQKPFTHMHVFPFSPRPGTRASALGDPIPGIEKKKRLWELKNIIHQKNYRFRQTMLHKKFEVIIEHENTACVGLTDNYIRTTIDRHCPHNGLVEVVIDEVGLDYTSASAPINKAIGD